MNPGHASNVPAEFKVPEGWKLVLQAHASGVQIYVCDVGAEGQAAWTLKGPEAELRDQQGTLIGQHYAGPTWKHLDGSAVTATVKARNSPNPSSIPWLLLKVNGHSGDGILSGVTMIQRINTAGGLPPAAECGAANRKTEVSVSYEADYLFYAPVE